MTFYHCRSTRHELKYIVSESLARCIRDFVRGYLSPDTNLGSHTSGYLVCSLYFDDERLTLYRETGEGHKNRFKLRLRYYDDRDSTPVFLEVKRRSTRVIHKSRAAVTRAGACATDGRTTSCFEIGDADEAAA